MGTWTRKRLRAKIYLLSFSIRSRVISARSRILIQEEGWELWQAAVKRRSARLQLSGDVVTNLQLQIDQLGDRVDTVITSETLALIGLSANSTADDAFQKIWNRLDLVSKGIGTMSLTVKDQNSKAIPNLEIIGIIDSNGNNVKTNSNGIASGNIAEGNRVLSCNDYIDLPKYSKTYNVIAGKSYSDIWTVTTKNYIAVTSTKNIKFSPRCSKISYSITAGGGGGGTGDLGTTYAYAGGGGGGGHSAHYTSVTITPDQNYQASVGAGGAAGCGGGSTAFMGNTVNGGNHGNFGGPAATGNGNGGVGQRIHESIGNTVGSDGTAGTEQAYTSYLSLGLVGGGGGGGGSKGRYATLAPTNPGNPYGGYGHSYNISDASYGAGRGYGGGGGGAGAAVSGSGSNSWPNIAGSGYGGFIGICIL